MSEKMSAQESAAHLAERIAAAFGDGNETIRVGGIVFAKRDFVAAVVSGATVTLVFRGADVETTTDGAHCVVRHHAQPDNIRSQVVALRDKMRSDGEHLAASGDPDVLQCASHRAEFADRLTAILDGAEFDEPGWP